MASALHSVRKFFPNVKTVLDATRNANIEVTKKDTKSKGVKKHTECAMALACKRKFKLDGVIISKGISYLIKGNKARRFKTTESVSREITSFDRGAGFRPGIYELSKITPGISLGPRNRPQYNKNRETKEKCKYHITEDIRVNL